VLALQNQMLPPTINLDNVDPECVLDYVANKAVPHSFDVALSNSFGFGGINATLIMKRWVE
jgi:3-oxoacyl-[acyl-carrier-protein] synthase II